MLITVTGLQPPGRMMPTATWVAMIVPIQIATVQSKARGLASRRTSGTTNRDAVIATTRQARTPPVLRPSA